MNYIGKIKTLLNELTEEEQKEVYDFAEFLYSRKSRNLMTDDFKQMLEYESKLKYRLECLDDGLSNEEYLSNLSNDISNIWIKNLRSIKIDINDKKSGLNEYIRNDVKDGLLNLSHVNIITELELNKNEYTNLKELMDWIRKDLDTTISLLRRLEKLNHVSISSLK